MSSAAIFKDFLMLFKQNPHFSKIWHFEFIWSYFCDKMVVTVNFHFRCKKILKYFGRVGTKSRDQSSGSLYSFKHCEKKVVTLSSGYTFQRTVFHFSWRLKHRMTLKFWTLMSEHLVNHPKWENCGYSQ